MGCWRPFPEVLNQQVAAKLKCQVPACLPRWIFSDVAFHARQIIQTGQQPPSSDRPASSYLLPYHPYPPLPSIGSFPFCSWSPLVVPLPPRQVNQLFSIFPNFHTTHGSYFYRAHDCESSHPHSRSTRQMFTSCPVPTVSSKMPHPLHR